MENNILELSFLKSIDFENDWKNAILSFKEELLTYNKSSKIYFSLNLLGYGNHGSSNELIFDIYKEGNNQDFIELLEDRPKTIKKWFSEIDYKGGVFYEFFYGHIYKEFKEIEHKVLKILFCSTNSNELLSYCELSKILFIVLEDGVIISSLNNREEVLNKHLISLSTFSYGSNKYFSLTDLLRNYNRNETDFLSITFNLIFSKIVEKYKIVLNENLINFKTESIIILQKFNSIEKIIKEKFINLKDIDADLENDLMNSFTNLKKFKGEINKQIDLVNESNFSLISNEILTKEYLFDQYLIKKINEIPEFLLRYDFYLKENQRGHKVFCPIFFDFIQKVIPFYQNHFSKTYKIIEIYLSNLLIVFSLIEKVESGITNREYKLIKSEIQDSGIFLNVFETLNLEKLDTVDISISKLISVTEQIGLEQIKKMMEINDSLTNINETLIQLEKSTIKGFEEINNSLFGANILSLIGILQRRNINKNITKLYDK